MLKVPPHLHPVKGLSDHASVGTRLANTGTKNFQLYASDSKTKGLSESLAIRTVKVPLDPHFTH